MDKINKDVKKLLHKVSGISDQDVASVTGKKEITLFDAFVLAVLNTERLAIEGENSIQAESRKLQAVTSFLPKLSLRGNKVFPAMSSKYTSTMRSSVSLYARLPIITGLDEVSNIKASYADVKIKELELYHKSGLLLMDVASAFYTVLQIEKSLKSSEEILNLYNKTLNELKRRVAIGRSRPSEILRTNSQIYKLQADIKSLHNDLNHMKLILAALTGIDNDYKLIDSENLNDPQYALSDATQLIETRWDVKAAKEQINYAESGITSAYGLHFPSMYVEGAYYLYQEKAQTSTLEKVLKARSSSFSSSPKYRDYYISIGAELPILWGDITFSKVREAKSKKRQADLNYLNTVRIANKEITDSFQAWESSKSELEAFHKALISAEENYKVVAAEYRLNQVTILDVLTSLTSLQGARIDYERTQLKLKLDRILLGIAINEFSGDKIKTLKK